MADGKTSSADAPPCSAMLAMRAASRLPSAYTPLTIGRSPSSSLEMSSTRRCSLKVHEATSDACAFTVIPVTPSTAATSRRCERYERSSIDRSSLNGSNTAGITPDGNHGALVMPPPEEPRILTLSSAHERSPTGASRDPGRKISRQYRRPRAGARAGQRLHPAERVCRGFSAVLRAQPEALSAPRDVEAGRPDVADARP